MMDARCSCKAIMSADPSRHFKECPLRGEYPLAMSGPEAYARRIGELELEAGKLRLELADWKASAEHLGARVLEVAKERDELQKRDVLLSEARSLARILAHAYRNDTRPPETVVTMALSYPVGHLADTCTHPQGFKDGWTCPTCGVQLGPICITTIRASFIADGPKRAATMAVWRPPLKGTDIVQQVAAAGLGIRTKFRWHRDEALFHIVWRPGTQASLGIRFEIDFPLGNVTECEAVAVDRDGREHHLPIIFVEKQRSHE